MPSKVIVVVGAHWGDEGKGRVIDYLAAQYDVIARCQGGQNAGHTVYRNGKPIVLQIIPSGVFYEGKIEIIGNGTVVNLGLLCKEIDNVRSMGGDLSRLYISDRAHTIPLYLIEKEKSRKSAKDINTTLQGIGDAYAAKMNRIGIRFSDMNRPAEELAKLVSKAIEELKIEGDALKIAEQQLRFYEYIQRNTGGVVQTSYFLNWLIDSGKSALIECAQGTLLDIDHGTYPFVTASNTAAAGAATGLGIAPHRITGVTGVMKAYITRVGNGPFPTELGTASELDREIEESKERGRKAGFTDERAIPLAPNDLESLELRERVLRGNASSYEIGKCIRIFGREFGARTGRPRRTGWQDLVLNDYSTMINGIDSVIVTKMDILDGFPELRVGLSYRMDEQEVSEMPTDLRMLERCVPEYTAFPGWSKPTSKAKSFEDLPKEATMYMDFLESSMKKRNNNLRIIGASVGPEREQLLMKAA
jgi:adenylosuccinate synthase